MISHSWPPLITIHSASTAFAASTGFSEPPREAFRRGVDGRNVEGPPRGFGGGRGAVDSGTHSRHYGYLFQQLVVGNVCRDVRLA